MYKVVLDKQAIKDNDKVMRSNYSKKVMSLLDLIEEDPFATPPAYKPLSFNLRGYYSRRVNRQHRIVYSVEMGKIVEGGKIYEGLVRVHRLWTHYGE